MKLIITKNYEEMTAESLKLVINLIKEKPDCTICMTTGSSPEGLAIGLAEAGNTGLDLTETTFMNLDEFIAPTDSVFSVRKFMDDCIYGRLKRLPKEMLMFDGEAEDLAAELARYKELLQKHPRDLQILGLGLNGHIGCNEPGTPFDQEAFVGYLTESTIQKTIDQFHLTPEKCPASMFTLGIKEIMEAKTVLLQVSGENKAEALKAMIEGEVTTGCPASVLMTHPDFVCIADEDAASRLKK